MDVFNGIIGNGNITHTFCEGNLLLKLFIPQVPPYIELTVSPRDVYDGNLTTLWCNVTASNPVTDNFTWRRGGEEVTAGVTSGANWSKLGLQPATCLDTDIYSCEATNQVHSPTRKEEDVTVLSKCI